ncbi:Adenylate and Guanylate cyclase catalytic domain protein [Candidatus Gugararchaeum adminiculabundum]|nr:Adenylate and Guanylate cyclase catalytic domain protein [Candidatus Gugararchaeum adminiculabundum]
MKSAGVVPKGAIKQPLPMDRLPEVQKKELVFKKYDELNGRLDSAKGLSRVVCKWKLHRLWNELSFFHKCKVLAGRDDPRELETFVRKLNNVHPFIRAASTDAVKKVAMGESFAVEEEDAKLEIFLKTRGQFPNKRMLTFGKIVVPLLATAFGGTTMLVQNASKYEFKRQADKLEADQAQQMRTKLSSMSSKIFDLVNDIISDFGIRADAKGSTVAYFASQTEKIFDSYILDDGTGVMKSCLLIDAKGNYVGGYVNGEKAAPGDNFLNLVKGHRFTQDENGLNFFVSALPAEKVKETADEAVRVVYKVKIEGKLHYLVAQFSSKNVLETAASELFSKKEWLKLTKGGSGKDIWPGYFLVQNEAGNTVTTFSTIQNDRLIKNAIKKSGLEPIYLGRYDAGERVVQKTMKLKVDGKWVGFRLDLKAFYNGNRMNVVGMLQPEAVYNASLSTELEKTQMRISRNTLGTIGGFGSLMLVLSIYAAALTMTSVKVREELARAETDAMSKDLKNLALEMALENNKAFLSGMAREAVRNGWKLTLYSELKDVVLAFMDIREFTKYASKTTGERLGTEYNILWSLLLLPQMIKDSEWEPVKLSDEQISRILEDVRKGKEAKDIPELKFLQDVGWLKELLDAHDKLWKQKEDGKSDRTIVERDFPEKFLRMQFEQDLKCEPVKLMGDAVLLNWDDRDSLAAVQGAITMQRTLGLFNEYMVNSGKKPFEVGFGVNTGTVLKGNFGSHVIMWSDILGDEVNQTSRFESMTKQWGIKFIATENVFAKPGLLDMEVEGWGGEKQAVGNCIRGFGRVSPKGKEQPVELFEVFANEKPEVRKLRIDNMDVHNEAVGSFRKKKFDEARKGFEAIRENYSAAGLKDGVAEAYLKAMAEREEGKLDPVIKQTLTDSGKFSGETIEEMMKARAESRTFEIVEKDDGAYIQMKNK